MFHRQAVRYGTPMVLGGIIFSSNKPVMNEPRRHFYEDEKDTVPIPGTVSPSPESKIEAIAPETIVNGASVRSSSVVEQGLKSVRLSLAGAMESANKFLSQGYDKFNEKEREVTTTFSALHERTEDLLPNSLYVLIAFLSGNIMARQRSIVAKATLPVILGVASFKYFLPKTFSNTTSFIWSVEQQKVPELAMQQELIYNKAGELVNSVETSTEKSQKYLKDSAQSLKKSVAKVTGLNIDEEVSKK